MLRFLIGVAGLVGLSKLARHRCRQQECGPDGQEGGCGWHRHHRRHHHCHHRGRGRRLGARFWLYPLFERLDATPGQEKLIRRELDAVLHSFGDLRAELRSGGPELAQALRGEAFDEAALTEMFARHDQRFADVRKAMVESLGRIHEALDERQRETLAAMLERGRPFGRGFGPYRGGDGG